MEAAGLFMETNWSSRDTGMECLEAVSYMWIGIERPLRPKGLAI